MNVRWATTGVLLMVAAMLGSVSMLEAADLQMQVFPGYDGHCKRGHWMPVTVLVVNQGPPTEGKLVIETQGDGRLTAFTREIDIPRASKRAYKLCVLAEGLDEDQITVTLRRRGRRRVVARAALKQHGEYDKLVLAASREPAGLHAAGGQKVPVLPLPGIGPRSGVGGYYYGYAYSEEDPGVGMESLVAPEDSGDVVVAPFNVLAAPAAGGTGLPDRALAYEAVEAVLLCGFPTGKMTDQEQSALRQWVARGGTLVVAYGGGLEDLGGPLMEELLPVEVAAEKPLTAAGSLVARYGARMPPLGEFLAASGPLRTGQVLAGSRPFPLLAARDYGCGRVYYLALDPRKQPLRGWGPGLRRLWREVLTRPKRLLPAGFGPAYAQSSMWGGGSSTPAAAVAEIPQMEAPSFGIVGLFLLLYVIFLVPVNYLVLRRLDKREWAWVTTPAIVLLFSVGAYASGRLLKGGQIIYHEANVATTVAAASTAYQDTFAGIFSPGRASYTVKLAPPLAAAVETLVSPGGRAQLEVQQGEEVTLPDVAINMWAMRAFHVVSNLELGGGVRATMGIKGDNIEGSIQNDTPYDLSHATVIRRRRTENIGKLPRGKSASFSLPIAPPKQSSTPSYPSGPSGGDSGASPEEAMLSSLEGSIIGNWQPLARGLGRSDILFVARVEGAEGPEVTFEPGRAQAAEATLLLVAIPVELTGATFNVPHGLTTARVVESSIDSLETTWSGSSGAQQRTMPKGYMVAEVDLPVSGWDLRFSGVRVYFSYSGKDVLRFAVRDWAAGAWRELPVSPGNRNNIRLPQPQRYVLLPEGKLQFRIENTSDKTSPAIGDLSASCQGWRVASGESE